MKISTKDLKSPALDWAVAKCLHGNLFMEPYSTDWSKGGPIIESKKLMLWYETRYTNHSWRAKHEDSAVVFYGPTPLIAAMRCYVASKLGDEVDVLKELI